MSLPADEELRLASLRHTQPATDTPDLQIIYVTGFNAAGKTTLSEQIAEKLAEVTEA